MSRSVPKTSMGAGVKYRCGWVRGASRSGMVGAGLGGPLMGLGVSQTSCRASSERGQP